MADINRLVSTARAVMGVSDAEAAVMIALHESDYSDLIDPAFLPGVARLVVSAARGALAEEFAEAIETGSASAKAYHYKAAVAKAARIVRDCGTRQPDDSQIKGRS